VLKRITEPSREIMAPLRWGQNYTTRNFIICASASNDGDISTENKAGGADSKYEEMGNLYNVIVGEPGRLTSLGQSRHKWKYNININLFLGGMACFILE